MKNAILKLEGSPQLIGIVESGGDYLRFQTRTDMTPEELRRLTDGQIKMDGKNERVLLESAQSTRRDGYTIELTLRRFAPSA